MKKIIILSLLLTLVSAVTGSVCQCCPVEAASVTSDAVILKAPHSMDCCSVLDAEREVCEMRKWENLPALSGTAAWNFFEKSFLDSPLFHNTRMENGSPPARRDAFPDILPKNPLYLTLEVLRF
jgi:hypothetical protein